MKKLIKQSKSNSNLIAKNLHFELEHLLKSAKSLPGPNLSAAPSSGQTGSPFKGRF